MEEVAKIMSEFRNLSRSPAAVVEELLRRNGRIATFSELSEAIEAVTGNRTTQQAVTCCIARANRQLGGKMKIKSRYGIGYQITIV